MASASKYERILELFFNEGSKHWHFEEIIQKSSLSRDKVNKWLKRFIDKDIICKIKENKKMPYYVGNFSSPIYKSKKRVYSLRKFYNSGFLPHLISLEKAKTVIIFGSFSRADWYTESDIDLFIYGDDSELEKGKYEIKLNREIQLFSCRDRKDFKHLGNALLRNIISGYLVKGDLNFVSEINA
ncbi:MAG: nucleotidyltransferase domain-containing protein [Nanoarchaeota archaeon]